MSEDKREGLPHEKAGVVEVAIEAIVKGYSTASIAFFLKQDFPELEEQTIETSIRQAIGFIRDRTLVDIDKIIPQHVEMYEKLYQEFHKLRHVPGKLKALKAKER